MQNENEIREIIKKAYTTTRVLEVIGYRSSEGAVTDHIVELLPSDGYIQLVKESLDMLKQGEFNAPPDPEGHLEVALKELKETFETSLYGERKPTSYNIVYAIEEDGVCIRDPEGENRAVVIFHLRSIQTTTQTKSEKKATQSRPKTLVKNAIKAQLPISSYIGQLVLGPGKFTTIRCVEDPSDAATT